MLHRYYRHEAFIIVSVPAGIDTDCLDGRIFWTDVSGRKIKSAAYNGSERVDFAMGGTNTQSVSL